MSRLTTSQIISLGEYLNPDFDPTSLTVTQLLGLLGFHNISYPVPYTKSKLVQQFNDEIKPRAAKFRRERLKKENSLPSDEGILDGVTGKPIGGGKSTAVRRSSRRTSRAPIEQEPLPARPEPPKRRRSSAQPALGEPPRKLLIEPQPLLKEESEPEEDLPVRKIGRKEKNTVDAGAQARRISHPAEDSGWEDNNIFQSGAESSSPARSSPARQKFARRSLAARKSRQSMSAPPQMSPTLSPKRGGELQETPTMVPWQPRFEPRLPSKVGVVSMAPASTAMTTRFVPADHASNKPVDDGDTSIVIGGAAVHSNNPFIEDPSKQEESEGSFESGDKEDEEHKLAISQRIAESGRLTKGQPDSLSLVPKSKPFAVQFLLALALLTALSLLLKFKRESATIGYCDAGKNTNAVLEAIKETREAAETCYRENRTHLRPSLDVDGFIMDEETLCPPPPLIPIPRPKTCTPCPKHASCTRDTVTCDTGYILRPHFLLPFLRPFSSRASTLEYSTSLSPSELMWKTISTLADGLPGLGPVTFPPRCLEDPKRKRNIGVLGKHIESVLGQERGKRLCMGVPSVISDRNGGEARRWGVSVAQLRETMQKKIAPHLLPIFDDTFDQAMQQLVLWGCVILGENTEHERYLAHQTPDLTWNCAITVKCREIWAEWRFAVIGAIALIVATYIGKLNRSRQQIENKRVSELVQIALDTLHNQEQAYHTDPVTVPQPYLSSLQLRDLILRDEHSISIRRRLWEKVERVVEGNANVRANLEEVHGGDEMRVWRWVGGSGLRKLT